MCLTCRKDTPYLLCDDCYRREKDYIKMAESYLSAPGAVAMSGLTHLENARVWCAEHERRKAEEARE